MYLCVRVCVWVRVCSCVFTSIRACVCVCVCVCACVCVCLDSRSCFSACAHANAEVGGGREE